MLIQLKNRMSSSASMDCVSVVFFREKGELASTLYPSSGYEKASWYRSSRTGGQVVASGRCGQVLLLRTGSCGCRIWKSCRCDLFFFMIFRPEKGDYVFPCSGVGDPSELHAQVRC